MIKSFRHAGLEKFFLTGSKAGIQPQHRKKLGLQLTLLNVASEPGHLNIPGWQLHPLKGDLSGHWSISVNGNWRLVFSFEGEHVILLDYEDYH